MARRRSQRGSGEIAAIKPLLRTSSSLAQRADPWLSGTSSVNIFRAMMMAPATRIPTASRG